MLIRPRSGLSAVLFCVIAEAQVALAAPSNPGVPPAETPLTGAATPTDPAPAVPTTEGEAASPAPEATAAPVPAETDAYLEARERVARGEKLFEEGNFDAALTEFERAYQTMEGHPARYLVLFNIGQCYEKLYRYDGAIDAYQRYLKDGGEGAEDAATVRAKMDLLETLLGRLELKVTVGGGKPMPDYELWVDGRFIGKNKTRALLPGGNHEVEIRAPGFELVKAPLQLPATAERSLTFELKPLAKEYKGLRPPLFWTTAAVAAGTAIAGGVVGFMALDERHRLDALKEQGEPACGHVYICGEPGADDPMKRLSNLATTADAFFIGAGVLTVTAVVLGFMTDFSGKGAEATEKTPPKVTLTPRGAGFSLQGAF